MSTLTVNNNVSLERISPKSLFSYLIGGVGDNVIYVMIVTFLMLYYTDSVGIPAATVGSIFLVTRIWDTFSDLFWGWLFDNTHSRFGKFRPWLLVGGSVCALSLIATFSIPSMPMTATITWACISYFMLSTSYTSFDVPYWALSTVITRNPQERNRVVILTRIGATCGQWLASIITLPLLALFAHSWSMVAIVYGIFFFICAVINFINVKEIQTQEKHEKHSLKVYWELLSKNTPLLVLMSFWIIINFTMSSRIGFGLYYFKYIFHSEEALATYLGVSTFLAFMGAIITPLLIKYMGKLNTCWISAVVSGGICCLLFFATTLNPWLAVILNSIPTLFLGVMTVVLGAMLPDAIAWHELENNRRVEGMAFSLNLFQLKLSGAIGGAVTGYVLGLCHYIPNVQQAAGTLLGINASFTLVPGILFLLAPLILTRYPLSEKFNQQIAQQLAQRDVLGLQEKI